MRALLKVLALLVTKCVDAVFCHYARRVLGQSQEVLA